MALLPVRERQDNNPIARLRDEMDDLIQGFFEGWRRRLPWADDGPRWTSRRLTANTSSRRKYRLQTRGHRHLGPRHNADYQRREETGKGGGRQGYYHSERSYGRFQRQLNSRRHQPGQDRCRLQERRLTITAAKSEKVKPMKVKVKG